MKKLILIIVILVIGGTLVFFVRRNNSPEPTYEVSPSETDQSFDEYPSDDTESGTLPQ